ncbi:hypothetical protein GLOIN_2v1849285 [Rhizophagus irregularis DAOM 181602=DAOM 197198]|nr:hypothetical protein GLOIN_2v1849285 [Rhizophagus irregularis DAOM 181602=DAOM 197198]GBC17866.2 hypothetical protein GLOIN_2v1849285 [Rhizophagus irregularis DAOM 181602=DAOM 197198]
MLRTNEIGLMLGYYISIDSLDDGLLVENAEIKAENAKVKVKNAKLKQAMKENEARLAKLEQSDKEKAKLIAELNCNVRKIKQEQVIVNVATQPSTSNKSLENRKTDEFLVSVSKKKNKHSTSQNTSNISLEDPNDFVETEANKAIHNHWEKRYQK